MPPATDGTRWRVGREQHGVEIFLVASCFLGWLKNPVLNASSWSISHGGGGVVANRSMEEKLRRTPTWRTKCRLTGFANPLEVRTLGCMRRSHSPQSADLLIS